mmetsp:Transcript_7567/g.15705  ORF Transcript_7567/g.15705 Transcript_7567/m.15705 type:complete len:299 (-) Transcript_7567:242-1138(-)
MSTTYRSIYRSTANLINVRFLSTAMSGSSARVSSLSSCSRGCSSRSSSSAMAINNSIPQSAQQADRQLPPAPSRLDLARLHHRQTSCIADRYSISVDAARRAIIEEEEWHLSIAEAQLVRRRRLEAELEDLDRDAAAERERHTKRSEGLTRRLAEEIGRRDGMRCEARVAACWSWAVEDDERVDDDDGAEMDTAGICGAKTLDDRTAQKDLDLRDDNQDRIKMEAADCDEHHHLDRDDLHHLRRSSSSSSRIIAINPWEQPAKKNLKMKSYTPGTLQKLKDKGFLNNETIVYVKRSER